MKKKLFVLDTSVILHDFKCRVSFKENDIAIPIQVLIELDNHKTGFGTTHFNARDFIRFLDSLDSSLVFDGGAKIGEELGKIRVVVKHDYHEKVSGIFPEKSMDHLIINTTYVLANDTNSKYSQVVLVSKDVNLRMKARALGLIAEDYRNDKVQDIELLQEGVRSLELDQKSISDLYNKKGAKEISFPGGDHGISDNEFLFIDPGNGKKSLGFYKEGKIFPIEKNDLNTFGIVPKNSEQSFALRGLLDPDITLFAIAGNAGTGKTILSLAAGLSQLRAGIYDEILFTRSIISVGNRDIGFLPGDANEKISPYMQGLWDNLGVIKELSLVNRKTIDEFQKENTIKIEPLSYIRGRSFAKKFFVVDEAQNLTQIEVKTIITRAGFGTKIVLIGDLHQIDNPYLDERSNGLSYVMEKMKGQKFYSKIILSKGERSPMAEVAGIVL